MNDTDFFTTIVEKTANKISMNHEDVQYNVYIPKKVCVSGVTFHNAIFDIDQVKLKKDKWTNTLSGVHHVYDADTIVNLTQLNTCNLLKNRTDISMQDIADIKEQVYSKWTYIAYISDDSTATIYAAIPLVSKLFHTIVDIPIESVLYDSVEPGDITIDIDETSAYLTTHTIGQILPGSRIATLYINNGDVDIQPDKTLIELRSHIVTVLNEAKLARDKKQKQVYMRYVSNTSYASRASFYKSCVDNAAMLRNPPSSEDVINSAYMYVGTVLHPTFTNIEKSNNSKNAKAIVGHAYMPNMQIKHKLEIDTNNKLSTEQTVQELKNYFDCLINVDNNAQYANNDTQDVDSLTHTRVFAKMLVGNKGNEWYLLQPMTMHYYCLAYSDAERYRHIVLQECMNNLIPVVKFSIVDGNIKNTKYMAGRIKTTCLDLINFDYSTVSDLHDYGDNSIYGYALQVNDIDIYTARIVQYMNETPIPTKRPVGLWRIL